MFHNEGSPPLPIFPSLTSLELELGDAPLHGLVWTAVINESPVLDSFAACASGPHSGVPCHVWLALLASLDNLAMPLKTLTLRPGSGGLDGMNRIGFETHSLAQFITRSKLQELVLPGDTVTVGVILNVISHLPTLKTLEVGYYTRFPWESRAPVTRNAFSSLECLKGDVMAIKSLLISLEFPNLTKLVITSDINRGELAWFVVPAIVGAIRQSCPVLEVLHLSLWLRPEKQGDIQLLGWPPASFVDNLQACHRLKDVRLDFSTAMFFGGTLSMEKDIVMSDEQWETLAIAWPDLVSIWYSWSDRDRPSGLYAPRPKATLKTIASFFRHCPNLSSFGIPLCAKGEEARMVLKEVSPRQYPTHLDFRQSWSEKKDAPDVAKFLAGLSPHPETNIQVPRRLLPSELSQEPWKLTLVEEQATEIARRDDWQCIKQLVESARNTRQP